MVCGSAKSQLEYDSSSPDMASYDIQRHTPIILWHETPHSNTHIQCHPSNALRTPTLECTTLSPESSCVSTRHIKDSLSRGPLWSMNRCFRVCRAEEREGRRVVQGSLESGRGWEQEKAGEIVFPPRWICGPDYQCSGVQYLCCRVVRVGEE
jgi:hypothetical protein